MTYKYLASCEMALGAYYSSCLDSALVLNTCLTIKRVIYLTHTFEFFPGIRLRLKGSKQ